MHEFPEITNNSLAYIMALVDAGTKDNSNQGVQETDDKSFYGLNAFNGDLKMPHSASVGTSVLSTIMTIALIYGCYRLLRLCWEKHEKRKRARQQKMLVALHNMGPGPQHSALNAALAGAAHLPGTAGAAAGAAGVAAHALQSLHQAATNPTAPPPKTGGSYPMIPGFAA